MEEDKAAMTGGVASSRDTVKPSEDILFCVDVDAESTVEMKTTGTANCSPLTKLECVKIAILRFVNDKLATNPNHRFAFATLSRSAAWLKKEFTSDAESAAASLKEISATKSSGPADLTFLFQEAAEQAKTTRAQNRILRVILIYCRSSVRPTYDWPINQKLFTLDVMYLHHKPGPNCTHDVYDSLVDAIESVSEYEGYIFESSHGLTQSVFKRMSTLLSYPPQRCAQVDLPKPPAKKPAISCDKSASDSKKGAKQPLEKTPNTNTKRIHSQGKEKATDLKNYDENLVGSRVKIWWPMDHAYYKAVVSTYYSGKERHRVRYDDGDEEILNMRTEKWYFVNESNLSKDKEANQTRCDEEASTMPQKKKAKTSKEQSTNKQDHQGPRESAEQQKAAEVSTSELTCVPERRLNLEHSLSYCPHDSSVNPAISSMNGNGHKAVSPRCETVAIGAVKTPERKILEMVQQPVAAEENLAETETQTHKRTQVESASLHSAPGEMDNKAAEREPSCRSHNSSAEPGDVHPKRLPQRCCVTQQLAKVKQSILDTIASVRQFRSELETKEQSIVDTLSIVRQFRSEIEKKEDSLEDSLLEIDVLGEKILEINKILN